MDKQKKANTPEKDDKKGSDPISQEKQRHKENLIQDIYDQISDEDDDEEDSGKNKDGVPNDNPFREQLMKDAAELKAKKNQEEAKNGHVNEMSDTGTKVANVLASYSTFAATGM